MTYMHEDEQYVVFTVGGGGQPAQLIAMTLPYGARRLLTVAVQRPLKA